MNNNKNQSQASEKQHILTEGKKAYENHARDALYAQDAVEEGSFTFNENVARVFSDMAQRSIPGYFDIQNFTAYYAAQYLRAAQADTTALCGILDIGASLGTTLMNISNYADAQNFSLKHCSAIACDNSPHMLRGAQHNLYQREKLWHSITYECVDIADATQRGALLKKYENSDVNLRVVVVHFVLQFTPPHLREQILHQVWNAMEEKSVLVIGEKLCANDEASQQVWDAMYTSFKRGMGYSEREIEGKRKALVGVLRPMPERAFTSLLEGLPHSSVDAFFAWGAFHAYAVHKGSALP